MTLGTILNLPGPSSLPLWNVDHNPCSASLRRLSGHQMKDCASLMLTFQPLKCQWKKGWKPGLGLEVGDGGTPAHVTQTAGHIDASTTRPSHYKEVGVITKKPQATLMVFFDTPVTLCLWAKSMWSSFQLINLHKGSTNKILCSQAVCRLFHSSLPSLTSLIYISCLAFLFDSA